MLVLDVPSVGRFAAVDDARQLTRRDSRRIVIAARYGAVHLRLRELHFVLTELGMLEDVAPDGEDLRGVFLERRKSDGARGLADRAFHRGRDVLELAVDFVTGLRRRPAASHDDAREVREPAFIGRVEEIAGADQREAAHERQFMVLQQEDLQAVREREHFRFGNLHFLQGREGQVLPGGERLDFPNGRLRPDGTGEDQSPSELIHDRPPWCGLAPAEAAPQPLW